jgi:predicted permease
MPLTHRIRVRAWLGETHSTSFELLRHFLVRFFDNEMVTLPGEWQKVGIGIVAALISAALAALGIYRDRYRHLHAVSFDIYRQDVRDDLVSFLVLAMAITAMLTILQWQSLFPSLRDCLALAGLPVRPREIFTAKFSALLIIFAIFVVVMTATPSILFAVLTNQHWHENPNAFVSMVANFAALGGACTFVFFTLLAIQGILLHLLSAHTFGRVSLAVQAVLFVLTVACLPLTGMQPAHAVWWPPVWFVHLWEAMVVGPGSQARNAILAIAIPAAISCLAYLLSYHRYQRMLLEAQTPAATARSTGLGARLLEWWIPDPREQAAFAFIGKTLFRSRSHRLLLLAYAGAALGWITKGLLDAPPVKLRDEGLYGLTVVLAPIAVAVLITVGLRYLFCLPVALRANWVFQAVQAEDTAAWLTAADRFVLWVGIAPVVLAGLPPAIAVFGLLRGVAATVLGGGAALVFYEYYFGEWRKLPFTSSYLPGKQPVWALVVRGGLASMCLGPLAQLFLWASAEPASFVAVATSLGVLRYRWRTQRWRDWPRAAMVWDEQPPAAVQSLNLRRAIDEDAPLSVGPIRPAERSFGDTLVASRGILPAAWREAITEDAGGARMFWETVWEDLRHGARLIVRNPLLSSVVVFTLAIGIGINASVFTVFNGVALKPHVDRDPASFLRIVPISESNGFPRFVSTSEYNALRERSRSVRQLAAYRVFPALIGDDDATGTPGLSVTCNFFLVEGVDRPILGRLLDAGDCRAPGQAPVAVINETIWRNRFHSDPAIVGRIARINNRSIPIVGVVAERTSLWVQPVGIWIPYTAQPFFDVDRNFFQEQVTWLQLAGRLNTGQTRTTARTEFAVLLRQLDALEPGRRTAVATTNGSWMEEFELRASARSLFLTAFFVGAFHLVLLIACANVATLLLSRAASRRREIAVRLSLGAPRIRLVRMLVTESVLLAALAGAASVWALYHVPRPLFRFLAPTAPQIPLPPDWHIFTYVAVVVLLTGIASGLAPALESVRVDLAATMKSSGTAGAGGSQVRGWLVSAQVAMSMVLLVEAALFGHSENSTLNADPGYQPRSVVVAPMVLAAHAAEGARGRLERIAARMRALPGVRGVTFSDDLPMIDHITVDVRLPSRPDAIQPIDLYSASADFMSTLGVVLVRGRDFETSDFGAVIIPESLERAFFRRQSAVGRTITLPQGSVRIVGVARDISPMRFGGSDNPPVWVGGLTHPNRTFMSVRFASPALASAPAVRAAIREIDPNLVVIARNLQSWIDLVTADLWNAVTLIVILGLVATVLAATGIYGAVSFTVNQRTRDLGIRVALGATRTDIVREVFAMGGRPVIKGLLIGLWISVAMAAGLRANMRGRIQIDSANPVVYGAAVLLLGLAAVIAMIGPAHRGSSADPLDALRCE